MKGHPGYQGDDLDWVAGHHSPGRLAARSKLLFDIYHVQIMHGDVIRRHRADTGTSSATSTPPATPAAANWTTSRRSTTRP